MIGKFKGKYVCSECGHEFAEDVNKDPMPERCSCECQEENSESEEIPQVPFDDISRYSLT